MAPASAHLQSDQGPRASGGLLSRLLHESLPNGGAMAAVCRSECHRQAAPAGRKPKNMALFDNFTGCRSGVSKENANAESLKVVAGFAKADEAQIRRSPALLCNRALENYMTIMPHATTEIRVRVA
mmetsp:Transcript_158680/g.304468  ORF Transcript_158680/g.304468 Transcript_158680/m.304468 type:complete len:126 (-) Transcript_158680:8-385(-)